MKYPVVADGKITFFHTHRDSPGLTVRIGVPEYGKQVFTFEAPNEPLLAFDISAVTSMIAEGAPPFDALDMREVLLAPQTIQHILKYNGVTIEGVQRAANFLNPPGYVVDFGDTQTVIDGNHRAVARFQAKMRHMTFVWLTRAQWRMVLLDIPKQFADLLD